MAIISGELPEGAALPSVRKLAKDLGVAVTTIVRVYHELLDEQLIRAVPKRGFFVSTGPAGDVDGASVQALRRLIDDALDNAIASDMSLAAFLQLCSEQVRRRQQAPRKIAVVGLQDASLEARVATIQSALGDLGVEVCGLSLERLEQDAAQSPPPPQPEQTAALPNISQFQWFVVSVEHIQWATQLLGTHARRIVPMTRTLEADVRDFIANQPDHTRFGIVAGSDALLGRILTVLRRLHPLVLPPLTTSMEHPDDIPRVLRSADAIILGSLAARHVHERLPRGKPSIILTYVPDERTLRRLRTLVQPTPA
jgi:GntR family transcriptional regulator